MRIEIVNNKYYINDCPLGQPDKSNRRTEDTERNFIWETHKGKRLYPSEMATPHLINAINMIWRNVFKLKEDHLEIRGEWSVAYIKRALKELTKELTTRVDTAYLL